MNNVKEYQGDLLDAKVDAIVHQCNCTTTGASGLARSIFDAYPDVNGYNRNPNPSRYGTFEIVYVEGAPFEAVVNMYTQLNRGHPLDDGIDTAEGRLLMFGTTLEQLLESSYPILSSFAFPKGIGCGLAGGNWSQYRSTIYQVASRLPFVEVHIVEKV
jgi:O-acetyl-ADP-ribose deacetylase (regulator of RNase III)